jgi:adenylate cyclase
MDGAKTRKRVRRRLSNVPVARFELAAMIRMSLPTLPMCLVTFEPDINPAIVLIDRALDLNPSFAIGWIWSGWLRLWSGQADLAIEHFEKSLRLNPRRKAPASYSIGVAHLFARRLDKAAAVLSLSIHENQNWAPSYRFLASCYAHMGRLHDAQDMVKRLREITPLLIPAAAHWRISEDREFYLAGLRLAAGETE